MFENGSVFAILNASREDKICRIEIDSHTQEKICDIFEQATQKLIGKQLIEFTGSYKPEKEEALYIKGYTLTDDIKDALRNPLDVESFNPKSCAISSVRAIFVGKRNEAQEGEKFNVSFQKFKKDQFFSVDKIRLFFNGQTFTEENKLIIAVSNGIDCVFNEDRLIFDSFYYARQVFDLSEHYRTATDADIEFLLKNNKLDFGGHDLEFKQNAKSWLRRKIALINDSKVLDNYTAEQIKALALQSDIDLTVSDGKIVIPNDKDKIKIIFSFLDEEAYKGPFSGNVLIANSKRTVEHKK